MMVRSLVLFWGTCSSIWLALVHLSGKTLAFSTATTSIRSPTVTQLKTLFTRINSAVMDEVAALPETAAAPKISDLPDLPIRRQLDDLGRLLAGPTLKDAEWAAVAKLLVEVADELARHSFPQPEERP
ncbi:unnamed protein product, partial [Heterosigma akashiwo]